MKRQDWSFLYRMLDQRQHDQHVWDYYFWLNICAALTSGEREAR